jgi:hypothetical protein
MTVMSSESESFAGIAWRDLLAPENKQAHRSSMRLKHKRSRLKKIHDRIRHFCAFAIELFVKYADTDPDKKSH